MSVRQPNARGGTIRRSQRTSQRSDDTARSDSSTISYSIPDPDRFFTDDGASAPATADISNGGGGNNKLDLIVQPPLPEQEPTTPTTAPPPGPEVKEKKLSAASRMARGFVGLKRAAGNRESQKSQKSNHSTGSQDGSSGQQQPPPMTPVANTMSPQPTLYLPPPPPPNRGEAGRQFAYSNNTAVASMRLGRVPEDEWAAEASYYYDDYVSEDETDDYSRKSVPIWLSICLVVAYIVWGAFIFKEWEGWSLLDSSYFCFITLTTIGFGDLVPNQQSQDGEMRLALCSLYLLFGIAMIAMSFNLVQEQVINSVKTLGRQLGILKDEDDEDDY